MSVAYIGDSAFEGCSNLDGIVIPENVTYIGHGAFYGTTWYNKQSDGVVYAGKVLYRHKGKMTANTSIEVREGTISISPCAFWNCNSSNLTSISIPKCVTSIGKEAFKGCSSLTSINIPESVISIGEGAFDGCSRLKSITIPEGVTSIGDYAFFDCSSLTSITCEAIIPPTIEVYTFSGVDASSIPLYAPPSIYLSIPVSKLMERVCQHSSYPYA